MKRYVTWALTLAALAVAGPARAEVNLEGVSGLLSTPTAEVVHDGGAVIGASRFISDTVRSTGEYIARAYTVTAGYLPNLELTARFTDYPELPDSLGTPNFQDRMVSAKYQFYQDEDWLLAAGATDFGGYSQKGKGFYGVATYRGLRGVELSLGAGSGPLSGVFGGLKWTPAERISLLAEYDSEDFNYGAEFKPLKGLALKTGVVNSQAAWQLAYSFPLDPRGRGTDCQPLSLARCAAEYASPCDQAAAVRDALTAESFENVLVGAAGETLYVDFESRRFTEQLDALAVAAALAATRSGAGITQLVLTPKLEDVPQLSLHAGVDELLAYLNDPNAAAACFNVTPYTAAARPPDIQYATETNKKNGHGEVLARLTSGLEIAAPGMPAWRSRFGLGLEENVFLGRGLKVRARQDWPLLNDIEEKTKPVNQDALLTYFDAWSPELFVLSSGGYYGNDRYGATAEAGYYFAGSRFKLGGRYAYIKDQRASHADKEDGIALGELSYYEPSVDLELSMLAGTFLESDQGVRFESRRSFGPTEITFFAYDTDGSKPHGGFRFFVPLPWYQQQRHGAWRVDGSPLFAYQYRTDSHAFGELPLAGFDLAGARRELRPEYVAQHLGELRRAVALFFGE